MKIFVVESSFGSYDDYRTTVEKAFYKREDAEEFKAKYEAHIRRALPEEPESECDTDEDYAIWDEWFTQKCEQDQFSGCYITEIELV